MLSLRLVSMDWFYIDQGSFSKWRGPIGIVEPFRSLLEDRGKSWKDIAHLSCNYLSNLIYFSKIICNPPIGPLAFTIVTAHLGYKPYNLVDWFRLNPKGASFSASTFLVILILGVWRSILIKEGFSRVCGLPGEAQSCHMLWGPHAKSMPAYWNSYSGTLVRPGKGPPCQFSVKAFILLLG